MAYTHRKIHYSPARNLHCRKIRTLTRGTMVSDVVLVIVWAATIPGLMWLGAAGGF